MEFKMYRIFTLTLFLFLSSCGGSSGSSSTPDDSHGDDDNNIETQDRVEKPQFQPQSGIFTKDTVVTISSATEDATIHYTLDGSKPDSNSTVYREKIAIHGNNKNIQISAIAIKPGLVSSSITEAQYRVAYEKILPVMASAPSGKYQEAFNLKLETKTTDTEIYYTLDGALPTADANKYTSEGIWLGENGGDVLVKAIALGENLITSDTFESLYQFTQLHEVDAPTFQQTNTQIDLMHESDLYQGTLTIHNPTENPFAWKINEIKIVKSKEHEAEENASPMSSFEKNSFLFNSSQLKKVSKKNTSPIRKPIVSVKTLEESKFLAGSIILKLSMEHSDSSALIEKQLAGMQAPKKNVKAGLAKAINERKDILFDALEEATRATLKNVHISNIEFISQSRDTIDGREMECSTLVVTMPDTSLHTLASVLNLLNDDENVIYAEPNFSLSTTETTPNDPSFFESYALQSRDGERPGPGIEATRAWDRVPGHKGNKSILIGVFDSGVDYNHPDLKDNIWINPGEIPDNNIDDDNNGYVDDVFGYDFANNDNDPMDNPASHGTHVAGIIGAAGNNGQGSAGVMWNANIVALKVFDHSINVSDAIKAVEYAKNLGIKIFNFSWKTSENSQALRDSLRDAGLVVIAAANDSFDLDKSPVFPASYDLPNILTVAATGEDGNLIPLSNWGVQSVDLAAPGGDIYSTIRDGEYDTKSGTSMAAPHVTGVAGLMSSYRNDLDPLALKRYILSSVDEVDSLKERVATGGLLNADKAMAAIALSWFSMDNNEGLIPANGDADITFSMQSALAVAGEYEFEIEVEIANQMDTRIENSSTRNLKTKVSVNIEPCFKAEIANETISLGEVRENQVVEYPITIKNSCNAPITLDNIETSSGAGNFTLGENDLTVYPFTSVSMPIFFQSQPGELGSYTGDVSIRTRQGLMLNSDFSVTNIIGAKLDIDTQTVAALQAKNTDRTYTHTVTNIGDRTLELHYRGGPSYFDRNTPNPPAYEWQEISKTGSKLSDLGEYAENVPVDLSFSFPFYSKTYSKIFIHGLGRVSFGAEYKSDNNEKIPIVAAPAMIAPFWNHIGLDAHDFVFFQDFGNYAIVQFENLDGYYHNFTAVYQLVLHASGEFHIRHKDMFGYTSNASLGYQDANGGEGVSIAFRDDYSRSKQVISVIQSPWLTVNKKSVTLEPGSSHQHSFIISTTELESGRYEGAFTIEHNGVNKNNNRIFVELDVE